MKKSKVIKTTNDMIEITVKDLEEITTNIKELALEGANGNVKLIKTQTEYYIRQVELISNLVFNKQGRD
jgi:hypothetical protein